MRSHECHSSGHCTAHVFYVPLEFRTEDLGSIIDFGPPFNKPVQWRWVNMLTSTEEGLMQSISDPFQLIKE